MANRATKEHVTLFVNTNERYHRPQQERQVTLFVNMNESKQRAKYHS